jgi:predicted MFS family arabinose efflux permease
MSGSTTLASSVNLEDMALHGPRTAVLMFLSFAFAYFFSTLLRAVTATLAPSFSAELGLDAGQLGLLAGAYFFGFATTQLPLGAALDRHGPRRVLLALLAVAVLGTAGFALSTGFASLTMSRLLIGIGVSACLMAPMTAYRHGFTPAAQLRANAWMLMTGSLGMVASTLPVQWLLPVVGWRPMFWAAALGLALAMLGVALCVPRDRPAAHADPGVAPPGFGVVFRHPAFVRFAPLAFLINGGLMAVQTLWAGPWLVQVCGWTADEAARGLFAMNLTMLLAYLGWGALAPALYRRGWRAERLLAVGAPLAAASLALIVLLGEHATAWALALYCAVCTAMSLAQPAVGQAFDKAIAGRALTAYNLMIFVGTFVLQWGIGLVVDGLLAAGASPVSAYRGAFALLAAGAAAAAAWFVWRGHRTPDRAGPAPA